MRSQGLDGRPKGHASADALRVAPVTPFPDTVAVGAGTALFLDGRCSHPSGPIQGLSIGLGSREVQALGWDMPRSGLGEGDHWWAIVPIDPVTEPSDEWVQLRARLADGSEIITRLGTIELVPSMPSPHEPNPAQLGAAFEAADRDGGPLVAIAMATFEPPIGLFRRQVASIRDQTHGRWICLISDDGSQPARVDEMKEVLGDDPRFVLSLAPEHSGFYRNFERALAMVPERADLVALCDQDDRWHPDKLGTLIGSLTPGSQLAYSDMRIVTEAGQVISATYWTYRQNNHTDFASLLVANTVTGASMLFERSLLDRILPFPPRQGNVYHDHWIAQVAMATGDLSYIDRPLYDYVQHGDAALGHLAANAFGRFNQPMRRRVRRRIGQLRRMGLHLGWRRLYFDLFCRIAIAARTLELRCGDALAPGRARILNRLTDSVGCMLWLGARSTRSWFGKMETLGRERAMLVGLVWRRAFVAQNRLKRLARAPRASRSETVPDAAQESAPPGGLTPILVDYFTRDGSTLMMRLLSTSPQIAVEAVYPYERKYFAYIWRWSNLLARQDWSEDEWGAGSLGTLDQFHRTAMLGPPPWTPRLLLESGPGNPIDAERWFQVAWEEFSRHAAARTREDHRGHAEVRYYAEKHLNTWLVPLEHLPSLKLIVLLRDPRDTWVSINSFTELRGTGRLGRDRHRSYEEHLEHVLRRQRQRLAWIADLLDGGEVPVIRYDDMIKDLAGVARRIERWLGVELDPADAASDLQMRFQHVSAASPEASLDRWKRELDPRIAERFTQELGAELRGVGLDA
jgi:glycosyltransferase involved in cell wall biosynthesis